MKSRPNILWISLEDTSPRFGCYGDEVARTPNIDRLAAAGCIYPRAFSVAGVCAPSRSAIITGMYPTSIGTHHMRTTHTVDPNRPLPYSACPPPHVKCFTEYLRGADYYCTNNAKTDYQFTPPFTAWDELGTNAHWRNRPQGTPFFAVFNPTVTHESGMWEEKHVDQPPRTDVAAVELPPYLPDTEPCRRALAHHYDNLEEADGRVGELLDQLDADGNGTLDREELGRVVQILRRFRGPATDAFKGNAAQRKTAENNGKQWENNRESRPQKTHLFCMSR